MQKYSISVHSVVRSIVTDIITCRSILPRFTQWYVALLPTPSHAEVFYLGSLTFSSAVEFRCTKFSAFHSVIVTTSCSGELQLKCECFLRFAEHKQYNFNKSRATSLISYTSLVALSYVILILNYIVYHLDKELNLFSFTLIYILVLWLL